MGDRYVEGHDHLETTTSSSYHSTLVTVQYNILGIIDANC